MFYPGECLPLFAAESIGASISESKPHARPACAATLANLLILQRFPEEYRTWPSLPKDDQAISIDPPLMTR